MSTVETALKKVKELSAAEARQLLEWLDARKATARRRKNGASPRPQKPARRRTMKKILAWYESIRGTTDWESPRMPSDSASCSSLG